MDDKSLQLLSESLKPSEEYIRKARAVVNKVFRLLQAESQYGLDRCRVLGGLAKNTSTRFKVFIRNSV